MGRPTGMKRKAAHVVNLGTPQEGLSVHTGGCHTRTGTTATPAGLAVRDSRPRCGRAWASRLIRCRFLSVAHVGLSGVSRVGTVPRTVLKYFPCAAGVQKGGHSQADQLSLRWVCYNRLSNLPGITQFNSMSSTFKRKCIFPLDMEK